MNADLIDLYRGVQHRKGNWRVGDRAWCFDCKTTHTITNFVYFCPKHKIHGEKQMYQYIWIPPVWSENGRCLIGMIKRDFSVTRIWYDSDDLTTGDGWIYGVDFIDGEFIGYYNSLPEALLRAIRAQEGSNADG